MPMRYQVYEGYSVIGYYHKFRIFENNKRDLLCAYPLVSMKTRLGIISYKDISYNEEVNECFQFNEVISV